MIRKIYIASDHAGFDLKSLILEKYNTSNEFIKDLGTNSKDSVDYPDFAKSLSKNIEINKNAIGILICGTGIGMSIAANRNTNIRAGLAATPEIVSLMRKHNNANVLVLPGRFIDVQNALNCVDKFLTTTFEGGRHKLRIDKINK